MATISLTIPNNVVSRVLDAITTRYGYQSAFADGTANPQSKQEFVRQIIIKYIKDEVKAHESSIAAANAVQNAYTDIDTNINIT